MSRVKFWDDISQSWQYADYDTGGTSNYTDLTNKPSINGHKLNGNQTAEQLDLQRKGNYLTEHQSLVDYAKKTELPTKTSQLANDSNYQNDKQVQNTVNQAIKSVTQFTYEKVSALPLTGVKGKIYLVTSTETTDKNIYDEYIWVDTTFELIGTTKIDLSGYVTDTQLEEKLKTKLNTTDISEWAKAPTKPTYTAKEVGALSESTVIPTKTSQLTNDSGFLTEHQDISGKLDKNQGSQNNGKILGIDAQGNVVPVVKPSGGTSKLEPLTFTGGASGEYDGSTPVTINIPTGGGGEWEYVDELPLTSEYSGTLIIDIASYPYKEFFFVLNDVPISKKRFYFFYNELATLQFACESYPTNIGIYICKMHNLYYGYGFSSNGFSTTPTVFKGSYPSPRDKKPISTFKMNFQPFGAEITTTVRLYGRK